MASKGEMWFFEQNCIAQSHSQTQTSTYDSELHSGGSREGAWGATPTSYFQTILRPKGLKKIFLATAPALSQGLGLALLHHAVTLRHISDETIQLPSESFEKEEENDTFFASMETIGAPDEICGFESQRVMGLNPNLGLGLFPSFHLMQKTYHVLHLQKTHLVISMSPLFKLRQSAVTVPWDCCRDKN